MFKLLLVFILICLACQGVSSSEELDEIFGGKRCIRASLISIPTTGETTSSLILEKDSTKTMMEGKRINLTKIINDPNMKFDKLSTQLIHEVALLNKVEVRYSVIEENGPPHIRTFKVKLTIGESGYFETYFGEGPSIKKAQQDAAFAALRDTKFKQPANSGKDVIQSPTVILNNVGMKLGIPIVYSETTKPPNKSDNLNLDNKFKWVSINSSFSSDVKLESQRLTTLDTRNKGPFWMSVRVEDREFLGRGVTLQAAKHDAAMKALEQLRKDVLVSNNVCLRDDSSELCTEKKNSLKNPTSLLHELGQQLRSQVLFDVVEENGPAHERTFVMRCKFGENVTKGSGMSKKAAKLAAAEKMWQLVKDTKVGISENEIVNGLAKGKKKKNKKAPILREITQTQNVEGTYGNIQIEDQNGGKQLKTEDDDGTSSNPKKLLLKTANLLNLKVTFTDLSKSPTYFYSMVSLGIDPDQICLGKAMTREKSQDDASLNALRYLKTLGMLEDLDFSKFPEVDRLSFLELFQETEDYFGFGEEIENNSY